MQATDPEKKKKVIPIPISWASAGWTITAFAGIVCTASLAVWEVRKDVIEDLERQIAAYAQSQTWKLPETITQLNTVSEKLQRQFSTQAEAEALKADNARLVKQGEVMSEQLSKLDAQLKSQAGRLHQLETEMQRSLSAVEQVTLKAGESVDIVKNQLFLGVSSIYSSSMMGRLNNESLHLDIGQSHSLDISGKKCSLLLSRVELKAVTFKFSCA